MTDKEAINKLKETQDSYLKDELDEAIETVLNLIQTQQEEIEKYKYLYQKALDNTIKSDRDILKKEKIIDLMAEHLTSPIHSKEWIKEYFINKVEKENKDE